MNFQDYIKEDFPRHPPKNAKLLYDFRTRYNELYKKNKDKIAIRKIMKDEFNVDDFEDWIKACERDNSNVRPMY